MDGGPAISWDCVLLEIKYDLEFHYKANCCGEHKRNYKVNLGEDNKPRDIPSMTVKKKGGEI